MNYNEKNENYKFLGDWFSTDALPEFRILFEV